MSSQDYQTSFNNWLDNALSQEIPSEVVAFAFNLSEPWSVEVHGTDRFMTMIRIGHAVRFFDRNRKALK
jgi:hypothetical protein